MALPLTAGLRVAMRLAKFAGKKLIRKGRKGYKLSRGLVKSPRVRTAYATATTSIAKRNLYSIKRGVSSAASGAKRHLKFYSKVISPQGTQFKNLITRPTFGQKRLFHPGAKPGSKYAGEYFTKTTKGMKTRSKLLKGGIYGGYIYGASKFRG